jgi:uncharacterized protein (TIGR02284 family)
MAVDERSPSQDTPGQVSTSPGSPPMSSTSGTSSTSGMSGISGPSGPSTTPGSSHPSGDPPTIPHAVGTGVGLVGGAVAGATAGMAAGPVGIAVGGVAGAVVGGLAGRAVAEVINPADEEARWNYHPPSGASSAPEGGSGALAASDRRSLLQVLQPLSQSCLDEEETFRACAAQAASTQLKTLFEQRAGDCQRGYRDLQVHLHRLDGEVSGGGRAREVLQRSWASIKGAFTGYDDERLLAEAQRQVDQALARYEQVLHQSLPADIQQLLERQRRAIQRHHDELHNLRSHHTAHH